MSEPTTSRSPDEQHSMTTDSTGDRRSDENSDDGTDAETDARPSVATGAETAVAALERAGATHLFGIQGGAIMPVYDAVYHSDLAHVTMAHEQGAAHAADAYGQVTGDPGVCLATSGPGATNLVTGIADANMDSDPLVALTGQVPTDLVGTDAFQETDTIGITDPITKANYFVGDPDAAGDAVGEAFALASEGRQGPTLVDLPKDATLGETSGETTDPTPPPTYDAPHRADEDAVAAAAEAIAESERPVLLAGGGVLAAEATDELYRFATDHGIPVVTTMPGLGAFPEDHDLSMGFAGMHGTGYANMAISHCDLLVGVGTRFDDRLTGDVETFAPEADVIHVDVDPAEISKNVYADFPLLGDAATVLDQLSGATTDSPAAADWRDQCGEWKREYPLAYAAPEDAPIKPQFVVEAVDAATADDAIVTTGVGQHQMWACQYWTFTEPRTWISSHGLGAMGYGLPAAIGAKVARPDRQVVCFDGDGSFLMTCQELAVAVREDLDITVFVLNNEAIGMVRQWQDGFFDGRRMASEYSWVPDFATLAEAFGARGITATDYDDLPDAIEEAMDYDGPAVVDVYVDPAENVFPMVPAGGANHEFALSEDHL